MYSGFVHQLSELINCRETASRHQETTSRSQKSARLQAIGNLCKQFTSKSNYIREVQTPPFPPASNIPEGRKVCAFIALITMS